MVAVIVLEDFYVVRIILLYGLLYNNSNVFSKLKSKSVVNQVVMFVL